MRAQSRWYSTGGFRFGRFCARLLPREAALWAGNALGSVCHNLSGQARQDLEGNLRLAGTREGDVGALGKEVFRRFGMMLADYFLFAAGRFPDPNLLVSQVRGFDHMKAALAKGRGVVLVTAHLGHWELGAVLLACHGVPMTVVTLPEPGTGLTEWRETYRKKYGIKTVTVGKDKFSFVEILRALRGNECVAMLVDRPYAGSGMPVRLFGKRTEFSSAPALLWEHTGATVLPAFVIQDENNKYISLIHEPVQMEAIGLAANTQRVANAFERIIREHLDQWFNFVPLFKEGTPCELLQGVDSPAAPGQAGDFA